MMYSVNYMIWLAVVCACVCVCVHVCLCVHVHVCVCVCERDVGCILSAGVLSVDELVIAVLLS